MMLIWVSEICLVIDLSLREGLSATTLLYHNTAMALRRDTALYQYFTPNLIRITLYYDVPFPTCDRKSDKFDCRS